MKLSSLFQSFYQSTFDQEPVDQDLQRRIAKKIFNTTDKDTMTIKNLVLRSAFAVLGLFTVVSVFAPNAFAQTVESVHDAFDTVVQTGASVFTFTMDGPQATTAGQPFQLPDGVLNESGQSGNIIDFTVTEEGDSKTMRFTDGETGISRQWRTMDNGASWEEVSE